VLRHSFKADVITFSLNILRVLNLTFIVTVPSENSDKAPVYVRFSLDESAQDPPGSVVVE